MSRVRCKMRVTKMTECTYPAFVNTIVEHKEVELSPVQGPENSTWSKYTPGGSIKLTINNPEAFSAFKIGEYYFVDFTPAPAKEADE